jgi:microcystin-dependent protein
MDPFVAEIRCFPFNFAPKGWAFCDGQILPISQNTALFSLLGTTYGGDGKSTFALPNLQGNVPIHQGQGPGLTLRQLGEMGGETNVTLLQSEIPLHNHNVLANVQNSGQTSVAAGNFPAKALGFAAGSNIYNTSAPDITFNQFAISVSGGNLPHNNMMPTLPYLTLYFNIALQGVFPPRS